MFFRGVHHAIKKIALIEKSMSYSITLREEENNSLTRVLSDLDAQLDDILTKSVNYSFSSSANCHLHFSLKSKHQRKKQSSLSPMAAAEIFLTPFITVLFDKLASADLISLARSSGIYSQINRWKKTLSQIQSVLADAGQKQISERAVHLWLHDLQDLAYNIDDVLDDLATEAMRRKLNQVSETSKVTSSLSLVPANSYDDDAFPSLEVLEFDDIQGWEIWSTNCGDSNSVVGSFPCLREISITNCPKLAIVSIGLIPSLQLLNIQGCYEEVFSSMVCLSSSILRLTIGYINGLTRLHGDVLRHLGRIEHICIRWCNELTYLWESEKQACNILERLQILRIESCENLVSLGNKDVNLESIREVNLRSCQRLESYNCPKSIEKLVIFNCPSITSLTFPTVGALPSSMKILDICGCDNLEESWLHHNFLSTLFICGLPNLRSFAKGCLVNLTNLTISNCDILESIHEEAFGYLPLLRIRSLRIIDCKNLNSFPYDQLQSVTSLEKLSIKDCPRLDSSFACGLWPSNLTSLRIGGLKNPMSKWGLQNFPTSLVRLYLHGENSGVVSFTSSSIFLIFPPSLTFLQIHGFMDLESVSQGLKHLTRLKQLHFASCPKLRDLPETLLPFLSCLSVKFCWKLQKRCSRTGNYWSIISQIPFLDRKIITWNEVGSLGSFEVEEISVSPSIRVRLKMARGEIEVRRTAMEGLKMKTRSRNGDGDGIRVRLKMKTETMEVAIKDLGFE
ncbi:hypothetical protein L1987_00989 [Smallanthus sonchifolius]|uniref:Uncharacterized protein n=1 Tax=Smallanthus sonchifolius TaxID=185202 RepID=A0ACB9K3U8_9ASTR|nr:hypothetical protein L1987_00989 [Smallanthus sonchifolius]